MTTPAPPPSPASLAEGRIARPQLAGIGAAPVELLAELLGGESTDAGALVLRILKLPPRKIVDEKQCHGRVVLSVSLCKAADGGHWQADGW